MKDDNSGAICGVNLETQYCNDMNSMQINIYFNKNLTRVFHGTRQTYEVSIEK